MKIVSKPICGMSAVVSSNKTSFNLPSCQQTLVVKAPGSLIGSLLEACDGKRTVSQVAELLGNEWDKAAVTQMLTELMKHKILVNSQELCEQSWKLVEKPVGFPTFLSDKDKARLVAKARRRQAVSYSGPLYKPPFTSLSRILQRRRSVRKFYGEVSFPGIINMFWSSYGETGDGHRTVPSAGALYPLMIHAVILNGTPELSTGVYKVHLGSPGTVGFDLISSDINSVLRSFLDPMMFDGAHGVQVISGSFRVTSEKYGSRSMLFVPLEAGHAAQNFNLAAVENNAATVEVGGFKEHLLKKALLLPDEYFPLITTIFGKDGSGKESSSFGKNVEVMWDIPMEGRYCPPFAIASARVVGRHSWAHGRDTEPRLAYTKAIAEAKEWASCGCIPRSMIKATVSDLKSVVDPRDVIRFHPFQYRIKGFPFRPLDRKLKYGWVKGYDEGTGEVVHILADLVHFPYFPNTPYYAYANSSGVAAHTVRQKALENSILELVERDAFMIAYLTRVNFPVVYEKSLPEYIKKRIDNLSSIGFKTWIIDHSIDIAPVVTIVAQSEECRFTTCAACSSFDIEHATSHALMEVEASVLARLQNGIPQKIKPTEVIMPLDHGRLYGQEQYFRRANFLYNASRKIAFNSIGRKVSRTWQELLINLNSKKMRLLTIPLHLSKSKGGNDGLHIIRSIIPGLIPMTFGYRQEPAGMQRIYEVAREFGGSSTTYGRLTKFPHPFE